MSIELKDFLVEVIDVVSPFRDTILSVLLRSNNGKLQSAAKARDGTISIELSTRDNVEQFEHIACLGSLDYLQSILKSSFMKNGSLELHYGESSQDDKIALKSIEMNGNKGFSAFYNATDPYMNQLNRIKTPALVKYPVGVVIDDDFSKQFDEMNKIHQTSAKKNSSYERVFRLIYANGKIGIIFGDKAQQVSLDLDEYPAIEPYDKNVSVFLDIEQFKIVCKTFNFRSSGLLMEFNDSSVKFSSLSNQTVADYTVTMVGKKVDVGF